MIGNFPRLSATQLCTENPDVTTIVYLINKITNSDLNKIRYM